MENYQVTRDQASTSIPGKPVNGFDIASKQAFVGQSSPALVSCHAGMKDSSGGSKEVCGSATVLPSICNKEISECLLMSTPSASQTAPGVGASCATPVSDCQDQRKTLYSRNATSVDRRSNEIRSNMKSSSLASSCSPASLNNGSNLSPESRSNGNRSTGLSTSDSIFTYSLTDDSHDELDEIDSKGERENDTKQKTLDATEDVKAADLQDQSNIPVPCDNNNFVDKITQVKNVIQKEYIHKIVFTFDELTSFEKNTSVMKSELCQSPNDEQVLQKSKKTHKTLSSTDQKDVGHKKFSNSRVKNFLRSMSPATRHRKPSKSSDSLSSRSSNTLAGSLDGASVNEELEETGASCKTMPKSTASLTKSSAFGDKSPADSPSSHGQKT